MRFSNAIRLSALTLLLASCTIGETTIGGDDTSPGGDDTPGGDGGVVMPHGKRVVGYYTSWSVYARNFHIADIKGELLTHINYGFVNISTAGECILGDAYADTEKAYPGDSQAPTALRGNFRQLQLLKQKHPHLKTLLSIGGWTWSTNFSALASTAAGRTKFAKSCADLMVKYGFDGLDIDWEFPGGGGLSPGSPADTANFTALLAATRAELAARGTYLLTIAAPAGPSTIANIQVAAIHSHLDWINVMTYDFHGGWETTTNFNAPLAAAPGDPVPANAKMTVIAAIDAWLAGGTPSNKLVMGTPFYGRGWQGVPATNNGLFQTSTGPSMGQWETGVYDYEDLATRFIPTMQRRWSAEAQVPWLYDAATGVMITYDDVESLTAKIRVAKTKGLGGAMLWELSGDDPQNTLLRGLVTELGRD